MSNIVWNWGSFLTDVHIHVPSIREHPYPFRFHLPGGSSMISNRCDKRVRLSPIVAWLSVLYWQRSCDSGVALGLTLVGSWHKSPKRCEDTFTSNGQAMSIVECLRWQNFVQSQDEALSTEGKAGVPRFDGEVTKLSEYEFRVRLRQVREKTMDESELKKIGPLALRLVDGLRGTALQVAKTLAVDELAKPQGVELLWSPCSSSCSHAPSKRRGIFTKLGPKMVESWVGNGEKAFHRLFYVEKPGMIWWLAWMTVWNSLKQSWLSKHFKTLASLRTINCWFALLCMATSRWTRSARSLLLNTAECMSLSFDVEKVAVASTTTVPRATTLSKAMGSSPTKAGEPITSRKLKMSTGKLLLSPWVAMRTPRATMQTHHGRLWMTRTRWSTLPSWRW